MTALAKGDHVIVRPASYPLERWPGVLQRRTPNGFAVSYDCHGIQMRDVFTARELVLDTTAGRIPQAPGACNEQA